MRDELDIEIDEYRRATANHHRLCDCDDCRDAQGPTYSGHEAVPESAVCTGMPAGGPNFPASNGCGRTFKPAHRHQAACPECVAKYYQEFELPWKRKHAPWLLTKAEGSPYKGVA